jgi:hypothetical protein
MNCRIARAYGTTPDVPWFWPLSFWLKVRNELIDSWKPVKEDSEDENW